MRKIRFRSSFNGEIADEIKNRDKLFKKSKLHIDKDIYNAARYKVRKLCLIKTDCFLKKKKGIRVPSKIENFKSKFFQVHGVPIRLK